MLTSMAIDRRPGALVWYGRVVLVGVACNILVATVAIIDPTAVIALLGLDPATPLVWPRFAALLLILMSVFYVPGALAPSERRFEAIYNIVCRAGGVVFFAFVGGPYIAFGLFDLVFGLPQAILLWRGLATLDAER